MYTQEPVLFSAGKIIAELDMTVVCIMGSACPWGYTEPSYGVCKIEKKKKML
jgi:hypothetical protein